MRSLLQIEVFDGAGVMLSATVDVRARRVTSMAWDYETLEGVFVGLNLLDGHVAGVLEEAVRGAVTSQIGARGFKGGDEHE